MPGDASPGRAVAAPRPRLEAAVAPTPYAFRLYVAGDAQNAARALSNLTAFCHAHLPGRHTIEIVDVLKDPLRALAEKIYMTPTLVALAPGPMRRIVGTLEDSNAFQQALGIVTDGT